MENVIVKRVALLAKLQENLAAQSQLYKDAVDGYQKVSTAKLTKALKKIAAGDMVTSISLTVPQDRTEQYDDAIALLEMSVDEEIKLTKYEFQNYVLDAWISQPEKHMMRTYAASSTNSAKYIVS